ncbi:MAG TPA: HXXEE domain-containing protein [Candidatus Binatia bacterium]|jgi:hypothetical protein|nr:HXXEE domain-containing protein [Candidatus Binatia bacterium]
MYWLPLVVFVAHMIEEFPRFPAWATRHFGATSTAWYVYSHCVLVAAALVLCPWAQGAPAQTWGPVVGTALMWTLGMNALFHVVTTFLFREYSPGVVTGVLLLLPAAGWVLVETVDDQLLTTAQIGVAFVLALVFQVAVIASLYLPMDIDWRFRRGAA